MESATKEQIKAINAILAKQGLMDDKKNIVQSWTQGRTTSTKDLYFNEAWLLVQALKNESLPSIEELRKERMARKIIAMAHEIGWIKPVSVVDPERGLVTKKDYTRLHDWIIKYGYLKKELREYTYMELPKLVTQFEFGVYKDYIAKL